MPKHAQNRTYDIVAAWTAVDGLAAVAQQDFGCILFDVNLPGQIGLDLLSDLLERFHHTLYAIVVITGDGPAGPRICFGRSTTVIRKIARYEHTTVIAMTALAMRELETSEIATMSIKSYARSPRRRR